MDIYRFCLSFLSFLSILSFDFSFLAASVRRWFRFLSCRHGTRSRRLMHSRRWLATRLRVWTTGRPRTPTASSGQEKKGEGGREGEREEKISCQGMEDENLAVLFFSTMWLREKSRLDTDEIGCLPRGENHIDGEEKGRLLSFLLFLTFSYFFFLSFLFLHSRPERSMTGIDGRPEVIITGSNDGSTWHEYNFIHKVCWQPQHRRCPSSSSS